MPKSKRGFTLIELLVVVIIIGILATLMIVALNAARARARDAQRKTQLNQLATGLEMYYNDKGIYPIGTVTISGTSQLTGNGFGAGSPVYVGSFTVPSGGNIDAYNYQSSDGSTYTLTTDLEAGEKDFVCTQDGCKEQ